MVPKESVLQETWASAKLILKSTALKEIIKANIIKKFFISESNKFWTMTQGELIYNYCVS